MRALRRAFSLGFPAGAIVVFIHWRGAAEVARRIRCAPWPAPVLSFFVIGSAAARGSASPRPACGGLVRALRRAFSLGFPAGAIVVFIHWRGAAEVARRITDKGKNKATANQSPLLKLFYEESHSKRTSTRQQLDCAKTL